MQRSRIPKLIGLFSGLLVWLLISIPHIARAINLIITSMSPLASVHAGWIYSTQLQTGGGTNEGVLDTRTNGGG